MTITKLLFTFPNKATALALATALRNARAIADGVSSEEISTWPDLDHFPTDGAVYGTDGVKHYYNIVELNELRTPVLATDENGMPTSGGDVVSGHHFLGAWRGEKSTIPAALLAYVSEHNGEEWVPVIG